MRNFLAVLLAAPMVSGCSSSSVTPVSSAAVQQSVATTSEPARELKRICLVTNPRVMDYTFVDAYKDALEKKGYAVEVVQKNPQPSQCPLSTRYTALGGPGNSLYHLEIYRDGKPAGSATLRGYYSETSLKELVSKLLP